MRLGNQPKETIVGQFLKLVFTAIALVLIAIPYLLLIAGLARLNMPDWLKLTTLIVFPGYLAFVYLLLKVTPLGKYLCDWPKHAGF